MFVCSMITMLTNRELCGNNVLVMAGIEMGKDGKLRTTTKAVTIGEVKRRTDCLRQKLSKRGIHSTVLKYLERNC